MSHSDQSISSLTECDYVNQRDDLTSALLISDHFYLWDSIILDDNAEPLTTLSFNNMITVLLQSVLYFVLYISTILMNS